MQGFQESLRSSMRIASTALLMTTSFFAFAQTPAPTTISVSPLIAEPGATRTIVVSGTWPNGCIPQAASITNVYPGGSVQNVVVNLNLPPPEVPCTLASRPFSVSTTMTPQGVGVQQLTAVSTNGLFVAKADVVTSSLSAQRALFDVGGLWYNPAVPGWGLSITHQHAGSGVASGTWYVYRTDGSTKWFTLQDITWDVPLLRGVQPTGAPVPQTMTANVYETIGSDCTGVQVQAIEACLVQWKEVKNVGRLSITFGTQSTGSITLFSLTPNTPLPTIIPLGPIQRLNF
jgi:hypothetical protein